VGEHAGAGDETLVANEKGDLAFEDIEAFFFPAVDVRGWPAAGRNECVKHGVLAAGVRAGGQEAINVANDGDGAPLAGFGDEKSCRTAHWVFPLVTGARSSRRVRCRSSESRQLSPAKLGPATHPTH